MVWRVIVANANKTFVDANIQISPPNATNEVGSPHTLTAHVNVNDGTGFVNAPAGTTINFTKLSGPGNLSATSCLTVAGDRELHDHLDLVDRRSDGGQGGDGRDGWWPGLASRDG